VWCGRSHRGSTRRQEQIERLPEAVHIFLAKYAYFSKRTQRYLLDADNGRYFNHSRTPNTSARTVAGEDEDILCATKNIRAGEELTMNYDDQEADHTEGNILETFYSKYHLVDEVDPRLKAHS
jgi:SET domain-containing protein